MLNLNTVDINSIGNTIGTLIFFVIIFIGIFIIIDEIFNLRGILGLSKSISKKY